MTDRKSISCPACQHSFAPSESGDELGSETGGGMGQVQIQAKPEHEVPPLAERARRGQRTGRGSLLRIALVVGGLVAGGAILWTFNRYLKPASSPPRVVQPVTDEPSLVDLVNTAERSVVLIESQSASGSASLGSGFVIDADGLVATNYHVIAEATEARVRFQDGRTAQIAGYAAVDPDSDLAIVKLDQAPRDLSAMRLRYDADPGKLASVVTIGHPHGIDFTSVDGRVSRVLETAELPSHSQQFLRKLMGRPLQQRWIQHTARLAEGNSGGPLLNRQGEVIGINTWVDKQTRFGYALHARHLHRLQQSPLADVAPLHQYARKEARLVSFLDRLTPERLEELVGKAEQMSWRPSAVEDYEVFQQLAWAATVARMPSDFARQGVLDDQLPELNRTIDELVTKLQAQRWDGFGQITLINEWASQRDRALEGTFFFAVVDRVVEGDAGERGAIVRLPGFDRRFFLPLHARLEVPAPETPCLVLGVHNGHELQFGPNPLKLESATVVAPGVLVSIQK